MEKFFGVGIFISLRDFDSSPFWQLRILHFLEKFFGVAIFISLRDFDSTRFWNLIFFLKSKKADIFWKSFLLWQFLFRCEILTVVVFGSCRFW